MHSLGFYHEHARSDRDLYIKIVEKNVRPGIVLPQTLGQSSLARWRGGFHFKFQDKKNNATLFRQVCKLPNNERWRDCAELWLRLQLNNALRAVLFQVNFLSGEKNIWKLRFSFQQEQARSSGNDCSQEGRSWHWTKVILRESIIQRKQKHKKNTKTQKKYKNTKKH